MKGFEKFNLNLKKYYRPSIKKMVIRSRIVSKGAVGLRSKTFFLADISLLKACVMFLRKKLKKKGHIFINSNVNFSSTKKPLELRMGKGKGTFRNNCFVIQPGSVFIEIELKNIKPKKFTRFFFKAFYLLYFYKQKFPFPTSVSVQKF